MLKEFVSKYIDMTDKELVELDLSDDLLAEISLKKAVESAKLALEMNERCYRKFGKKMMTAAQTEIFQKMAKGVFPTDDEMEFLNNEQITFSMDAVKKARQNDIQTAALIGDRYQPSLTLEDKTDFGIN